VIIYYFFDGADNHLFGNKAEAMIAAAELAADGNGFPTEVEKCLLRQMNKTAILTILNSGGDEWCEQVLETYPVPQPDGVQNDT